MDNQIDYSFAGPGGKRRRAEERRLREEERPHSPGRKERNKTKPARRERLEREWRDVSGSEIKARVMALTLAGNDPRRILAALEQEDIRVTLVTVGNLHRYFKDAIKVLRGLGLIHQARLERYLARD